MRIASMEIANVAFSQTGPCRGGLPVLLEKATERAASPSVCGSAFLHAVTGAADLVRLTQQ